MGSQVPSRIEIGNVACLGGQNIILTTLGKRAKAPVAESGLSNASGLLEPQSIAICFGEQCTGTAGDEVIETI